MSYQDVKLHDLLGTLIDYRGKTPPKTDAGIPLITAKVIKGGRILDNDHEYIAEDYYDEWMRRGLPRQWDVLITTEAPLGEVAILKTTEKVALAQRVILLRGDSQKIDQRYLCFALQSPLVQARLNARATGATVAGIKQSELREVLLPLYPLATQRRIASILSAYDDLIANNTRRIAILEEMARRIYEEWFVRFRFPGHEQVKTVESELGLIPEGWSTQRLVEAAFVTMGQSPSSEHYNFEGKGLPFHQGVTDFGAHYPSHRMYCTVAGRMAMEGDILMSVRAPVGRINLAPSDMVIGRGLCAIRSRTGQQWFLLHRLLEKFKEEDCMGNGAIFKAVTKQDVLGILFPKAPDALEADFERQVAPLWQSIRNLTLKNRNLRATRDLLLPKLISGELDVSTLPEPEEAIAA
ncbi:MAG: type restriction enzyme subunit [Rhodocyclaceae bacterium]|nr:type restriction enzyme subunit [Rhodocyclaceae bacterium]